MAGKKKRKQINKRQQSAAAQKNQPTRQCAGGGKASARAAAYAAKGKPGKASAATAANTAKGKPLNQKKPSSFQPPPSPLFDKNNLLETFARVFLLAMVFLFPLAMGAEKYGNITHFKNSVFYVLAALALCSVIVAMIIKVISTPSDQFSVEMPKFNLPDIAVLCYWGFLFLSALLSPYKDVAFNGQGVRNDGMIIQSFYVAVYFLISHLMKLRKFDLNVYVFGGTAVAALVMIHFFGIDILNTGFSKPNWESGLLFMGPMGNINLTSYFVTVALVLAAGIFITQQQLSFDKKGAVTLSCFALMLWAELNLNTDAGIVALGAVILAALPLMLISLERVGRFFAVISTALATIAFNRLVVETWILEEDFGAAGWLMIFGAILLAAGAVFICRDWEHTALKAIRQKLDTAFTRRRLLIAAVAVDALAVVGVLIASFFAAKSKKSGVLYEFGQILYHGNFNDKFGHNRMFTWKRTLKLVGKKPFFGSGPDSFCTVFNEVYGEESSQFFGGRNLDKAHNEYLQLLICSGFTGLGAFLTFLGSLIVRAFRRATENPLLVCCGAAVIAYAVHAIFGYSLPINTPLMWVLLGLTGAAVRIQPEAAE